MSDYYSRLMDELERDLLDGKISYAEACAIADELNGEGDD